MAESISRKDKILVSTLLVGAFLAVLNQTLATSALPAIMASLSISADTAQWLTSAYTLVYAIVIPLSSFLMKRFSTRKLFFGAYGALLAGSIVAALAPDFPILLVGRLLQAVCVGVLTPLTMTVVMLVFPMEKRGIGMGIANVVVGIAPAAGPLFAGVVTDYLGWHAMFACVALIAVAVMVIAAFVLPNLSNGQAASLDIPSALLCSLGLIFMLYGFGAVASSENPAIPLCIAAGGIVVLGLFAHRQQGIGNPLLNLSILHKHAFRTGVVAILVMQALFMGASQLVPLLVQQGLGQSATVSGLVVMPGALVGLVVSLLSGRIFDVLGVKAPTLIGAGALVAGFVGLAFAPQSGLIALGFFMALVTCGSMMAFTPLLTWGINAIGQDSIADGNAISNTARQASTALGTALFVSLMSGASTWHGGATEGLFFGLQVAFVVELALAAILFVWLAFSIRKS